LAVRRKVTLGQADAFRLCSANFRVQPQPLPLLHRRPIRLRPDNREQQRDPNPDPHLGKPAKGHQPRRACLPPSLPESGELTPHFFHRQPLTPNPIVSTLSEWQDSLRVESVIAKSTHFVAVPEYPRNSPHRAAWVSSLSRQNSTHDKLPAPPLTPRPRIPILKPMGKVCIAACSCCLCCMGNVCCCAGRSLS